MHFDKQPITPKVLRGVEAVYEHGAFFTQGWQSLCDPSRARCDIDLIDFFQRLIGIACGPVDRGAVMLFMSKNDKPLGFMVLQENSESRNRRSLLIYAGYSNGKCVKGPERCIKLVEDWARTHGFDEVQAQSRRINGAAMRLFKRKLGFQPLSIVFKKML